MSKRMTDMALIGLARYRFEQADQDGASPEDMRHLLDLMPAVLDRLREYAMASHTLAREFAVIDRIDLKDPDTQPA